MLLSVKYKVKTDFLVYIHRELLIKNVFCALEMKQMLSQVKHKHKNRG